MKKLYYKARDFLIQVKIYMARTSSYISLVNTAMILFLFLSNLEKYNINIRIKKWIIPMFIAGILVMLFFGYLEYKFFFSQEQKATQSKSPHLNEIIERLDRIEKKLGKK